MNGSREDCLKLKGLDAQGILKWASETFGSRVALATSFGAEDQVLTDLCAGLKDNTRVFTLDTGRFFQETYDVMEETMVRYGLPLQVYPPNAEDLARLIETDGPNLFHQSVEKRKACCAVRKTFPLQRALTGLEAWITGLRKGQSVTRSGTQPVEWDEEHSLYKISPLYDWPEERVWSYIRAQRVPYNKLHDKGFPSIGCAPCTRAVAPGEDVRAGRWWWELPEHRECGLHNRPEKE